MCYSDKLRRPVLIFVFLKQRHLNCINTDACPYWGDMSAPSSMHGSPLGKEEDRKNHFFPSNTSMPLYNSSFLEPSTLPPITVCHLWFNLFVNCAVYSQPSLISFYFFFLPTPGSQSASVSSPSYQCSILDNYNVGKGLSDYFSLRYKWLIDSIPVLSFPGHLHFNRG